MMFIAFERLIRINRNRMAGGMGTAISWACLALLFAAAILPASEAKGNSDPSHVHVLPPTWNAGDSHPYPQGDVVLTVNGAENGPSGAPLRFDIVGLESLGTVRYTSKNKWNSKPISYEGVLGSVFLAAVGLPQGATRLKLRALNDYVAYVPIEDFFRWPVMLALKLDGAYMSVRNKGPIWVVYPNHIDPELGSAAFQGKWIWQLAEITIE